MVLQSGRRAICTPEKPVVVSAGAATIGLHPATETGLRASYFLDYGARSR